MPKKIPTVVALLLIITLLAAVGIAFERLTRIQTVATASIDPKNIQVVNVTDTSASVVWETADPGTGMVMTSDGGKKVTAFDDRDTTGSMGKYVTHMATLKNLKPQTKYVFTITSQGKKYTSSGSMYSFSTAITLPPQELKDSLEPAYGVVKNDNGGAAVGALVILSLDESQTLATLVKPSGSWIIPLNTLRLKDYSSYILKADRMGETITISLGDKKTVITTDSLNDSPVPDIILGSDYDFRNQEAKRKEQSTLASIQKEPEVLGTQDTAKTGAVSITAPLDKASLTSARPLFQGTGIVGKTVTITIGLTKPIAGKTTVGQNGIWQYTPSKTLATGKQSVTITTVDAKGKPIAITHSFTILKSGTQVLGDATASASLTPTVTPIPTTTGTQSATLTTTPTPTTDAALTAEPMPTSGSPLPLIIMVMVAVGLIGGGIITFFPK